MRHENTVNLCDCLRYANFIDTPLTTADIRNIWLRVRPSQALTSTAHVIATAGSTRPALLFGLAHQEIAACISCPRVHTSTGSLMHLGFPPARVVGLGSVRNRCTSALITPDRTRLILCRLCSYTTDARKSISIAALA